MILKLQTVNSPPSIAGDYQAAGAAFGPALTAAGLTGNVVLGNDGTGSTSDACTALLNGAAIAGNIALVDRGTCAFTVKVKNAQNAGATGVIVANTAVGAPGGMAGADSSITIPSVMVAQSTGNSTKGALPGVNVTMRLDGGVVEDSYRWLIGEVATSFGNGGQYVLVPASAYIFNPYNTTLLPTNPLAPQPGLSGTDGGQVTGSWGQSQIDLAALGVLPGNTIRLRFDFGMDGCAGIDG